MPARKSTRATVLTPVSDTAAQLIHLLRQEAAEAAAPAPGTVTLRPAARLITRRSSHTNITAYSEDWETRVDLWCLHDHWNVTRWSGEEQRTDADGRRWERRIVAVVDDFGSLVEVRQ
jgi:hypothetical protein